MNDTIEFVAYQAAMDLIEKYRRVEKAARQLLKDADREWGESPQSYQADRSDLRRELAALDNTPVDMVRRGDEVKPEWHDGPHGECEVEARHYHEIVLVPNSPDQHSAGQTK